MNNYLRGIYKVRVLVEIKMINLKDKIIIFL
jgi:hypothetical protein